jgi:hypothetical protein
MIIKSQVIETIDNLPDSFTLNDVFDAIQLLQKVDNGLEHSVPDETFSTPQAKERMSQWFG